MFRSFPGLFPIALFWAMAGSLEPAWPETLADYAIVKTARCFSGCTRDAQYAPSPSRGVTIESGNLLSTRFTNKIVDFERRTASLIISTSARDGSGKSSISSIEQQKETALSEEEVSYAVRLANRIWNPPPPSVRPPGSPPPPPPCTDSFYTFTLLDEAAVFPILDTCGFRNNKNRIDEGAFELWLDSVLARAQPVQSGVLVPGVRIASFSGPPPGWGRINIAVDIIGVVDTFDATSITVKPDNGGVTETVPVLPTADYAQNKLVSPNDIKSNDFVSSAAIRGVDGKLHSIELTIIAEALRGNLQGRYPIKDTPNQIMTIATVTDTAVVNGSYIIKVKMGNIESELILDPGVPVTALNLTDKTNVKPGVRVRVQGVKTLGGQVANRITLQ